MKVSLLESSFLEFGGRRGSGGGLAGLLANSGGGAKGGNRGAGGGLAALLGGGGGGARFPPHKFNVFSRNLCQHLARFRLYRDGFV